MKIREYLAEAARSAVEETLNSMLNVEADQLCRAARTLRGAE